MKDRGILCQQCGSKTITERQLCPACGANLHTFPSHGDFSDDEKDPASLSDVGRFAETKASDDRQHISGHQQAGSFMGTLGSLVSISLGIVAMVIAVNVHLAMVRDSDGSIGLSLLGAALAGAFAGLGIVVPLRLFHLRATGQIQAAAALIGLVGFIVFSYQVYDSTYITSAMQTNLQGEGDSIHDFVRRDTGEPITYWYYLTNLVAYPWLAIPIGALGYTGGSLGVVVSLAAEKPYCEDCRRYMTTRRLFALPYGVFQANRQLLAESMQTTSGLHEFTAQANQEQTNKDEPHVVVDLVSCPNCSQGRLVIRYNAKRGKDGFEESSREEVVLSSDVVRVVS